MTLLYILLNIYIGSATYVFITGGWYILADIYVYRRKCYHYRDNTIVECKCDSTWGDIISWSITIALPIANTIAMIVHIHDSAKSLTASLMELSDKPIIKRAKEKDNV